MNKQLLVIIVCGSILLFFALAKVKSVMAHDNESQKYYDNRKFDGNFPASQIRTLWQVCSFTFQTKHPGIPQALRWETCDCYTDVIREMMTPEEALNSTASQAKELTLKLINQCNDKFNPKPDVQT